jgi:Leucine-rich repeat (LRR) protein
MAEQFLFSAVEKIIETLGSPAAKEIGQLLWGVEYELQSVRNTVSKIKDVLPDAGEKQARNPEVRDWLGKLSDAIYDADDLLDGICAEPIRREISTHDKKGKKVRIFFSKSNQILYRFKMVDKIKAIRERLDTINKAAGAFHFEVRPVETRVGGNRARDTTHSFVRADAVVGREDDRDAVIHRLVDLNVEENVLILPIVGVGGLGKTTLAQLIFNNETITKHFELKMWVYVSDTFHVKNIVEKILQSATKKKQETVEMDTLVGDLRKEIDGKRYLLVLDDMWNEDHEKWSHLKEVLLGGARGSRILVTTRNESVARTIHKESVARIIGTVQSYSLTGLNKDASWSLFKEKAFEGGQEPENSSIVALGREILEKCLGVPLAIRKVGSSLYFSNSEREWLSFKNNELSKISREVSYDQLPPHLKHCFAYCSLFPKDYMIDKSTLIKLWMAQGFVKSKEQNRCLEDVGDEYFMDLLRISFFQEAEMDEFGNIIGCKIFGLMHDLAISVAGSLITTLDDNSRNFDEKTRHVSCGCDMNISSVVPTLLDKTSTIRTFLFLGGDYFRSEMNCDATIFSSFKFLRVLHLRNLDFVPSSIGKLKYLRYLDLSRNYKIEKLPDSITRLQHLQTLRLSECESLKELPRDIKKLVNLRHLELDGCKSLEELPRDIKKLINLRHLEIDECGHLTYMPRGLGQLTNLQKLSRFVVHSSHSDSGGLKELNRLNNLKGKLVIENLEHGEGLASEYEAANLKDKEHLDALHLHWSSQGYVNDSDVSNDELSLEAFRPPQNLKLFCLEKYRGSSLPIWLLSLTNLVRFELLWCTKCQYLPELSQLPSLKYLVLTSLDAMEYISDGGDRNEKIPFFPSLKEISLSCCHNLKGWWRHSSVDVNSNSHNSIEIMEHRLLHSFPLLSRLSIQHCPMLTSMPMFPYLEEMLDLKDASSKLLQKTMTMNMAAPQSPTSTATSSSSSTSLSKLKSIILGSIAGLETLPLQNLTSLKSLKVSNCHILKSLSPGIQHLTALEDLDLFNCLEIELANDEDGMQWQGLRSLLSLRFSRLPKLVSLPSGLQHVTTLQKLEISDCLNLTAIPEWIHNYKSLQVLEIRGCLSLASVPKGIHNITSLQSIVIDKCPILLQ